MIERLEGSTILDDELNDLFKELDKDNSNEIEYVFKKYYYSNE